MSINDDHWAEGSAYDAYMGRWSHILAHAFLLWLGPAPQLRWLDVGCGTGALSAAVLQAADPELVIGCDPAASFIEYANAQSPDPRLSFRVASLTDLPQVAGAFDFIVSGLVLNFLPDPVAGLRAMLNRCRPGGVVAAYVWDYAGRMDFLRTFWDVAADLDPSATAWDEGRRFPLCQPAPLSNVCQQAGLSQVRTDALDITMLFNSFDDYWRPFLAGTGPAPAYVASLSDDRRHQLENSLRHRLPLDRRGKISLLARAWAVCGERP